ncbi:hypothetical protein BP6252_13341 [Coleophoma cylindrospora]|uniref:Uncharacterized protein n=1 Tax=Coleophoma cylindrospora TaxID=1849047 RepID=A0A3D8QAJ6_9HELO|nr:hypothetical protein BP6252_13341 [Coleophoma cylindrospora]
MIPMPPADYPLNQETWGHDLERGAEKDGKWGQAVLNTWIHFHLGYWDRRQHRDDILWEEYREAFEDWKEEWFTGASTKALKELRTYLTTHGVWVRPQAGSNSYAKVLQEVLDEEQPHKWTEDEIQEHLKKHKVMYSDEHGTRTDTTSQTVTNHQNRTQEETPIVQTPQPEEQPSPVRTSPVPTSVTGQVPYQPFTRFTPDVHPALQEQSPVPYEPQNTSNERTYPTRLTMELRKIYPEDQKYSGEESDILDVKLQVFYDLCRSAGIQNNQLQFAYGIMLRGKAVDFYYKHICGRKLTFAKMVQDTKSHFETEERRLKYLLEWRETTLHDVIRDNPTKTKLECLNILFDKLCTAQLAMPQHYQNENSLRDQILNACRGIKECSFACYKPAPTFQGLCADLRSAVSQAAQVKQRASYLQEELDELSEAEIPT